MKSIMLFLDTVKKAFVYKGRASRKEFWNFVAWCFIVNFVLGVFAAGMAAIADILGALFGFVYLLLLLAELIIAISVSVRRMHDVGLSGFWLFYLSAFGLPLVYVATLMDVDVSCRKVADRVPTPSWLGWILTWLFWPVGAPVAKLLLFLCDSKEGENEFGAQPLD